MEIRHIVIVPAERAGRLGIVQAICGEFVIFGRGPRSPIDLEELVICPECFDDSVLMAPIETTDQIFFIPASVLPPPIVV